MKKPYSKSKFAVDGDRVPDPWFTFICEIKKWKCRNQGSNQGPPVSEAKHLPLSYQSIDKQLELANQM